MRTIRPDEVYNLGAQSHVRVSFDVPEYTADTDAMGTLRLLDAIREEGVQARFYQASSSEMFGKVREVPQTEETPFHPRSPYGVAQGLRLLDHAQLPRGLRHVRGQRDPLQPRVAAARRDVRDAQDHARRRRDPARRAGRAQPRQPRREARLGLRADYMDGDVADAAAGRARRLRARDRRDALGARVPRRRVRARRPRLEGLREDRRALLPPGGGRPPDRRLRRRRRPRSAGSRRCASTSSCR